MLDAFLAVYELRTERASTRDPYYVSNLPSECRPAKAKGPEESEHATPDIVRRTVAETRKRLSDSAVKWDTFLAARNLHVLLDDEKLEPEEVKRIRGLLSSGTAKEREKDKES